LVRPNLIHPVDVEIQQVDKPNTSYRSDAREPVRKLKRKATITLSAQVKWRRSVDPRNTLEGVAEDSDGYLLFRYHDLADAGVTLKRGDKIIKIARLAYELFITQLIPAGHYPDQNGPSLLKAFFSDRNPA
jgi:hypothetical protein